MSFDPDSDETQQVSAAAWAEVLERARASGMSIDEVDIALTGAWRDLPRVRGRHCAACMGEVRLSPSGPVCEQGHGGEDVPDGTEEQPAPRGELVILFDAPPEAPPELPPALGSPDVLYVTEEEGRRGDADAGFDPSEDQRAALTALLDALLLPGEYALTGAAGAGKTTVMKALLRRLTPAWAIHLLAPTWRAALRLREVTERETMSVHRAIYGKPVEERLCPCGDWSADLMEPVKVEVELTDEEGGAPSKAVLPRFVCPHCNAKHEDACRFLHRLAFTRREASGSGDGPPPEARLVIIDEASMVPPKMARDVREAFDKHTRILWVGDPNQLPPVLDEEERTDTEGAVPLLTPTAALHRIHRQAAGSPVLALAHNLKTVPEVSQVEYPFPRFTRGVMTEFGAPLNAVAMWAAAHRTGGQDSAVVVYSNNTRAHLNHGIRVCSGAAGYAFEHGLNLIPGDLLLARTNGLGVFNGEVWTLVGLHRIQPGTRMLGDDGRAWRDRRRRSYRHDRTLEGGIGVWAVELTNRGVRGWVLIAAPTDTRGNPVLESDLIRAGIAAGAARQRCREITRAWREEYEAAIEDKEAEFASAREAALDARSARARLEACIEYGDLSGANRALRRLASALKHAPVKLVQVPESPEAWFASPEGQPFLPQPSEAVADCGTVEDYCRRVYNALDPRMACVFDFGEALTCYAMQGSQAENVAVVFDGGFWFRWRNDREATLKWAYTAVTRTSGQLALFSVRKDA